MFINNTFTAYSKEAIACFAYLKMSNTMHLKSLIKQIGISFCRTKPLAIKNAHPPPKSSMRQALPQIIAASVKNVVLLSFGMTLGYPTILIPSFLNANTTDSFTLNPEQISWIGTKPKTTAKKLLIAVFLQDR